MMIEATAAKRSRQHTVYKLANGTRVPGVTTILGVLNKPALVNWANNLGLQGIKSSTYVDALAQVGTIAHDMVNCHLQNKKFDPTDLPADLIDAAENSFLKYLEWERKHKVVPILCEAPMVSEEHGYGGTVDCYAKIDGVLSLLDFKTSTGIFPEHIYQVSAYRELLKENYFQVDAVGILQIGRSEDEGFSEKTIADSSREWAIFEHCLALYQLGVGK